MAAHWATNCSPTCRPATRSLSTAHSARSATR
jgi:hypothetical protein